VTKTAKKKTKKEAIVAPHTWTNGGDHVRLLKRIDKSTRTTKNGFKWPGVGGTAACNDWNSEKKWGGGSDIAGRLGVGQNLFPSVQHVA